MKKSTIASIIMMTSSLYAINTEKIGDILSLAIPLGAYSTTLYLDDKEGQYQFYKTYGTTLAISYGLKHLVKEKRPDSDDTDSFPSMHTSSAFSGAALIHKRYGFNYAIIPYLGAIYTAYSRIHANKHHKHDVIAGALIGTVSSWIFTTPYKNLTIKPEVEGDYKGIQLNYKW